MEEKLATESFQASHLLKTSADIYIKEAIIHFRQLEMTKSANLFLKSWRLLTSEDQKYSEIWEEIKNENSTRGAHEVSIEQMKRGELQRCIIYDLALACLRNDKAYEDSQGNPTLDVYICQEAGTGNTTAEKLKYDGKDKEIGTDVGVILKLQDPFGAMLRCAHTYIDAACLIAYFGLSRVNYRRAWGLKDSEQAEFAWRSLIWIYNLTHWHNYWDHDNSKKIGLRTTPYGKYPTFLTEEDGWAKRFYQ